MPFEAEKLAMKKKKTEQELSELETKVQILCLQEQVEELVQQQVVVVELAEPEVVMVLG